ncbi:ABC transporter permease [Parablautia muri]|uniref:Uncharacterized protein n=1 Tax=Parablautia muri TaxID=2320879 RepID=A0A9X5GTE7_9FIRM|nr:ABC transporter permease [Parablautia muri]NBJ94119.1 hypothetical protein [Parablautia muri]
MKNRLQIYGILWKQYLFKYKWWILFVLIFALAAGVAGGKSVHKESDYRGITAGVCWSDEKGRQLLTKLEQEKGIFKFQGFENVSEMIREVENGTLECGYELSWDFYEELLNGKAKRQVTLYYSPASSTHKISFEIVFVNLFEMLSEDILRHYLRENGFGNGTGEDVDRLLALNKQYAEDGSGFHFVYETTQEKEDKAPENLNSFRGCMAVMMFLMCLLGLGNALEQERIWKALPGHLGRQAKSGYIHVAVLGSILTGGLCLLLQGMLSHRVSFSKEIVALLAYAVVLEIYVRVLNLFIKKSREVYGLLPVLVLGSCLFSPVFIRMENYLPAVLWVSKIFPTTYYLRLFF